VWSQEVIGRVLLVLEPVACPWEDGAAQVKHYIDARNIYSGTNAGNTQEDADEYVNCFHSLNSRDNFKILRAWDFELSPGAAGQESYYPLFCAVKFKKPITTTTDDSIPHAPHKGLGIQKNRLSFVFFCRGACNITGCVRQNFTDA
jgi:hypothetical protein